MSSSGLKAEINEKCAVKWRGDGESSEGGTAGEGAGEVVAEDAGGEMAEMAKTKNGRVPRVDDGI